MTADSALDRGWLDSRFDASLIDDITSRGLFLPAPDNKACDNSSSANQSSVSFATTTPSGLRSEVCLSDSNSSLAHYIRPELHAGGFKSEICASAEAACESKVIKLGRIETRTGCEAVTYEDILAWYEKELGYCDASSVDFYDGYVYLSFETQEDAALVYEYLKTEIVSIDVEKTVYDVFLPAPTAGRRQVLTVSMCTNEKELLVAVANKILLVTVTDVRYPVSMEMLTRLFSLYGTVEKIITFAKGGSNSYQALIQLDNKHAARQALASLDGKNLYAHSNKLEVQYSKLKELVVQHNNGKAWDYTRNIESAISPGYNEILSMPKLPKEIKEWKAASSGTTSPILIVYDVSTRRLDEIFNVFSLYGIVTRIKLLRDKEETVLVQYSDPIYASMARHFLQGVSFWEKPIQIGPSKIADIKLGSGESGDDAGSCGGSSGVVRSKSFQQADQRFCEAQKFAKSACAPTNTIFIASISLDTPHERLVDLVRQPGQVLHHEIRLPYHGGPKKTHMLVEYANVQQALTAIATLHNLQLDNSQLKIAFSKIKLSKAKHKK